MTFLISIQQPVLAWQVPAAQVPRIVAALPEHRVIYATTDEARAAGLRECDAAFTWRFSADELPHAPQLRWVHTPAVALGTLCVEALAARGVRITNSRGVQATPIAEHVMALVLAMTRRLPLALRRQQDARWAQAEFVGDAQPDTLRGKTLGVVGLGSIGSEVARLGRAFGMDVVAVRRDAGKGAPDGVRTVWPADELDALLAVSDVVVIAAPLTSETEALIDGRRLALMKRGARLVNVSRGQLVDAEALTAALSSGQLSGAALDVAPREPLPPDDPLWRAPNLVLTPHTSGYRPDHWDDVADLFVANARRFAAGQPLQWLVDPVRGY